MNKLSRFIRLLAGHAVVRSSAIVLSGSMVANILAYLFHLVVGRILGPAQYGELSALLSLFYILNVPSSVVQTILTKFFSVLRAKNKPGEVRTLFFLSIRVMIVLAIVGLGLVFLGVGALASFLHIQSTINFYWLYCIFALYFIGMVPISLLQAYQLFFAQSVLTSSGMALRLVFAAIAAPFGVTWILLSNIFANIMTLVVYAAPLKFLFKTRSKPLSLSFHRTIGYSVPTVLTTLAVAALYNQDVLLVKHFFTSTDAGIYSSLSILGKVIFYASSAITYVLFPVIAERKELKRGHTRLVGTALLSVGLMSGGLTVFYYLFPQFVVHLLYGSSFDAAIPYVGLFGIFISFFALDNILISISLAAEKVRVWLLGGVAAIVQFGMIWFFHASLYTIIEINITVAAVLFVSLLLYYVHAKESD